MKFWKSKIESITENVARRRLEIFRNNKEFEMGFLRKLIDFRKFEKSIFVFDVGTWPQENRGPMKIQLRNYWA